MIGWPEWAWRLTSVLCIIGGVVAILLLDPIYKKMKKPCLTIVIVSTIIFCLMGWFFIITDIETLEETPPEITTEQTQPEKEPVIIKQIIKQEAQTGNLKERAIALSQEVMRDLYAHGWPLPNQPGSPDIPYESPLIPQPMPTTFKENIEWNERRSDTFKFFCLKKVLDIRNEFAQLHIKDKRLEDFFKYQGIIEVSNKKMAELLQPKMSNDIDAIEIKWVAESLVFLAKQIDD